jgi:hypothetical protein
LPGNPKIEIQFLKNWLKMNGVLGVKRIVECARISDLYFCIKWEHHVLKLGEVEIQGL